MNQDYLVILANQDYLVIPAIPDFLATQCYRAPSLPAWHVVAVWVQSLPCRSSRYVGKQPSRRP